MAGEEKTASIPRSLESKGWLSVDPDALVKLAEQHEVSLTDERALEHLVLTSDLRKFGRAVYPKDLTNGAYIGSFDGPLVMQVLSISNITQPSIRQEANDGSRLLSVRLTDGVVKATGLEYKRIDALSLDTPPGTKVLVKRVQIVRGKLLLTPTCFKVLGGEVPALVSSWAASRELASNYLKGVKKGDASGEGPPPFEVFRPGKEGGGGGGRQKAPAQQPAVAKDDEEGEGSIPEPARGGGGGEGGGGRGGGRKGGDGGGRNKGGGGGGGGGKGGGRDRGGGGGGRSGGGGGSSSGGHGERGRGGSRGGRRGGRGGYGRDDAPSMPPPDALPPPPSQTQRGPYGQDRAPPPPPRHHEARGGAGGGGGGRGAGVFRRESDRYDPESGGGGGRGGRGGRGRREGGRRRGRDMEEVERPSQGMTLADLLDAKLRV